MRIDYSLAASGFAIHRILDLSTYDKLRRTVVEEVLKRIGAKEGQDLSRYHIWYSNCSVERNIAFAPSNRHFKNNDFFDEEIIPIIKEFLEGRYKYKLEIWDEGYGRSAFRMIRPGFNDGYPASCKAWGPAGQVLSVTIPIVGFTRFESPGFLIGSHLKDYEGEILRNKFQHDELRLIDSHKYTFTYLDNCEGDSIVFHWKTMHTEQIIGRETTRVSYEMRFKLII